MKLLRGRAGDNSWMSLHRSRRARGLALLPLLCAAAAAAPAAAPPRGPAQAPFGLIDSVALMLANDPNLVLAQARLTTAQGALSIQQGTFDPVISASFGYTDTRLPVFGSAPEDDSALIASFGLTQELHSGATISPGVDLNSSTGDLSLTGLPNSGLPGIVNTGTVSFTLRQPLLRGRGSKAAAAGEHAAEREAEASALDLRFTTAQRILAVATQYWTATAARRDLDILRSYEDSSRQLLVTTRRLIAADVTPAAEAVQLEASLAAAEAARIAGENALFTARQSLGREIGLDGSQAAALPLPSEIFPRPAPAAVEPDGTARFVAGALRCRADLQAAQLRQDEAGILLAAAENGLLPQLDLVLTPSYSGLMGGGGVASFFAPLVRQVPGIGSALSLQLSLPVENHRARGLLLQAEATRQQNAALVDQLRKSIGTDVPSAVDSVARGAQQLERDAQAVHLYERAVANEERKLSAGSSTLLDVLTQRDRLLTAQRAEVSVELALAVALAQLRFATGTMLAAHGGVESVDVLRLTTVPTAKEMAL
jgi:outer membrane protein